MDSSEDSSSESSDHKRSTVKTNEQNLDYSQIKSFKIDDRDELDYTQLNLTSVGTYSNTVPKKRPQKNISAIGRVDNLYVKIFHKTLEKFGIYSRLPRKV